MDSSIRRSRSRYSSENNSQQASDVSPTNVVSLHEAEQIMHIDTEVRNIREGAINALLEQCASLNRQRNGLVAAVKLPQEILTIIFEFSCCPTDEGRYSTIVDKSFWQGRRSGIFYGRLRQAGPFFVSRVCSMWRRVALDTPQLWNNIKVEVSYDEKESEKQALLLQYWLSNSHHRFLTVGLTLESLEDQDYEDGTYVYGVPTSVVDVLATHAHRLCAAELLVTGVWTSALAYIGQHANMLTSLTLELPEIIDDIVDCVDFFSTLPELSDVKLIGYSIRDVPLPTEQIVSLSTDNVDTSDPPEALRLFPNLQRYTLNTRSFGVDSDTSMIGPLVHHTLASLELILSCKADLGAILEKLSLPKLRSFSLTLDKGIPSVTSIENFLMRCGCTLETLHLGSSLPDGRLVKLLLKLPELRELSLQLSSGVAISRWALDLMNPRKQAREIGISADDVACLVPNLESFTCHGTIAFDPRFLVEFLVDRWDNANDEVPDCNKGIPVARLRSAKFSQTLMKLEDEDADVLSRLRLEGMRVEICK
ncbi:hypothetical protein BDN70DRAFT_946937 [Pholiota conissans]|uniref:F-box domain-containing protein n=1 Tax=Pholiota conissans TaxID=109636 RepID=A0A9P5ZBW2_9AGAR|nr:hypothetical protein BDN70DRAFT_946937 [Pholiota conissans]